MTLADYLAQENDSDIRRELVNGELVDMPLQSWDNVLIARFLLTQFLTILPFYRVCCKDVELSVSGAYATVRLPDLMVISEELAAVLAGQPKSLITQDMPPPMLVVEVVSPGKTNQERDYYYKRSEYAARQILEYWIVDPGRAVVMVLSWADGRYLDATFQMGDRILSPIFPTLELTVDQVLGCV
jgi:Uma2 family endonuclease